MRKLVDPNRLYSLEAEAAVLGAMLIDPDEAIPKVLPRLPRSEAFFLPEHRIIYDALVKLYIGSVPIDAVALRAELNQTGQLQKVGGVEYLGKILDAVPNTANCLYYGDIVRAKMKERSVRSAVQQMDDIIDEHVTVDEMIDEIQDIALGLEPLSTGPDYIEVKDEAAIIATEMQDTRGHAIATGFRDLDKLVTGFYPGELIIIAGRPSMGKSTLALDFALNMGKKEIGSLFITLEMTERSLIERAICNLAGVDSARVRAGECDEAEQYEITRQARELQGMNIVISKNGSMPEQIAAMVHRLKQTHEVGIVFVDYLQLMGSGSRTENRQQEITTISRKLKGIALRENIPLVVLSQLNRAVENRENHRPRMSDLRESGSIEQDADLVMLLYRDDYYHRDEPDHEPNGMTELNISKNRRGPTGVQTLVFVKEYTKFGNLPERFVGGLC
jgi:replicative DNA helicase